METTFMTIHNLTAEANILFASESIVDILGYNAEEVTGKSCFDYFHPDEVPFARNVHSRGVQLDKAAVLHYARIKGRDGQWIGCECVFTVVYEVLVACTSIYRGDAKNERRAVEAPAIRRIFASSPRDPRYHMLEHLSSKFRSPPQASLLEPRAALILNRFTRTLTIMYATNAVTSILGVSPQQVNGKSFYECIQENCLPEAIRCLESAKANDSIAYLRFWYRDPRHDEEREDEQMREASQSSDSEDGGVELNSRMDVDIDPNSNVKTEGNSSRQEGQEPSGQETIHHSASSVHQTSSRTSSRQSTDLAHDSARTMFDGHQPSRSSTSSLVMSPEQRRRAGAVRAPTPVAEPYEIEAVVSCTSDGLVVILRRARPMIPSAAQPVLPHVGNGLFAAPWGANPIRPHIFQPNPQHPFQHGLQAPQFPAGGPAVDEFMVSIREVAVFAWSLAGINGNIAEYGHGVPRGEAQPAGGLPVWNPYAQPAPIYHGPENQAAQRWAGEKTAEIRDSDMVPSQYHHQEDNFRYHQRYSNEPIGFDQPSAQVQARNQIVHHAPVGQNVSYENGNGQPREQAGGIGGPSVGMSNNATTAQAPGGLSEGSRGNRYLWY